MASQDVVAQIQHERLVEAEEARLGHAATGRPASHQGFGLRLRLGLWLIAAGRSLAAGEPAARQTAWAGPAGRAAGPSARRH